MKENEILKKDEVEQQEGEAVTSDRHRSHWDLLALLICLALAFTVWLCVMNVTDTDYLPLELVETVEGIDYELSAEGLLVEGTVSALKGIDKIEVKVPEYATTPGTYYLTEADLDLPEGIYPEGELRLTLTVLE